MTTEDEQPKGIQLTPLDDAYRENPYKILRHIQEHSPAYYDEVFGRYIVSRHDDVQSILRNRDYWVDGRKANPGTFPQKLMDLTEEPMMISMDNPDHKRLRGLVTRAFTQKAAEAMRGRVRQIAEELLDSIQESEFEFVTRFAAPFAISVIANMMGFSRKEDQAHFNDWSDIFMNAIFSVGASEEQRALGKEVQGKLRDLFMHEIEAKRLQPGEGLIADMVGAQEGDERLSDGEIVRMCELVLIAGNVTTRDTLGNGLKALLKHPAQMQKLRANPKLMPNAVEEMLRYDCPVQASGRIPSEDTVVSGCPISKGEFIYTSLAAANHDPRTYPDVDKFDIEREDVHHHAFGGGSHFCLGAILARVELQEAFAALLARYRTIAFSDQGYQYDRVPNFRGLAQFWIKVET
ncbi:cytochrome P450 [Sorangium sp. So ce1151]|uniref:cytochrome P450 n=1 Tax=Sorangium sp. So ce1151 TaxID=3133332 RepID=UPI003F5E7D48